MGQSFNIKYHEMPDVSDFLILKHTYEESIKCNWKPNKKFWSMVNDYWWHGAVKYQEPLDPKFPNSVFMCYSILWDTGERERLSPWDMESTDKADIFPCAVCRKGVGHNSILCKTCNRWVHKRCSDIKGKINSADNFRCKRCKEKIFNNLQGVKVVENNRPPHLTSGNEWRASKVIARTQQITIPVVAYSNTGSLDESLPLFRSLNILTVYQVYAINCSLFIHKFIKKKFISGFGDIDAIILLSFFVIWDCNFYQTSLHIIRRVEPGTWVSCSILAAVKKVTELAHRTNQMANAGSKGKPKIVGLKIQPQLTRALKNGELLIKNAENEKYQKIFSTFCPILNNWYIDTLRLKRQFLKNRDMKQRTFERIAICSVATKRQGEADVAGQSRLLLAHATSENIQMKAENILTRRSRNPKSDKSAPMLSISKEYYIFLITLLSCCNNPMEFFPLEYLFKPFFFSQNWNVEC
ncbi:unnamed protein product, partial [Meganyctiphanes norvegica]